MRFRVLSVLVVVAAGLADASPIRVVVAELPSPNIRYGHPAAPPLADRPALLRPPVAYVNATDARPDGVPRRLCQSMRAKAIDASNYLRHVLGLDPIVTTGPGGPTIIAHIQVSPTQLEPPINHPTHDNLVHILPVPFIGTPVRPPVTHTDHPWPHRHHLHSSFLRRVHHALMALGPWEGRAVAFVLGCGIGVLLRMFWVILLVTARALRGSPDAEEQYAVLFDDAEMLVPPPQYTIVQDLQSDPVPVDDKPEKEGTI